MYTPSAAAPPPRSWALVSCSVRTNPPAQAGPVPAPHVQYPWSRLLPRRQRRQ